MKPGDVAQLHRDEQLDASVRDWIASGGALAVMTPAETHAYLRVRDSGAKRGEYPAGSCDACQEQPAERAIVLDAFGGALRVHMCRECIGEPEPDNAA